LLFDWARHSSIVKQEVVAESRCVELWAYQKTGSGKEP